MKLEKAITIIDDVTGYGDCDIIDVLTGTIFSEEEAGELKRFMEE